ncbi:MAG TPA: hypothetical protein VGM79_16105 [Streptosporangiaceae bacterium]|jgi:hypothetical protein
MTTVFSACAVCPFPETCEDFGLCEDPAAAGSQDAGDRAAAITAQLSALPERDVRQFLADLAAADPDAVAAALARFTAGRTGRGEPGQAFR